VSCVAGGKNFHPKLKEKKQRWCERGEGGNVKKQKKRYSNRGGSLQNMTRGRRKIRGNSS